MLAEGQCPGSRGCLPPLMPWGSWRMGLALVPHPPLEADQAGLWKVAGVQLTPSPASGMQRAGEQAECAPPTSLNQWLFLGVRCTAASLSRCTSQPMSSSVIVTPAWTGGKVRGTHSRPLQGGSLCSGSSEGESG